MVERPALYTCTSCGTEYTARTRVCEVCGGSDFLSPEPERAAKVDTGRESFPAETAARPFECPHCGEAVPADLSVCGYCGEPLTETVRSGRSGTCLQAPDGTKIPLYEGLPLLLGRDPSRSSWARLAEGNSFVSGLHAEIEVRDGRILVRDLGSTNGTFVRGIRIDRSANIEIEDGICIGLSRHLDLIVRLS